MLFRSPSAGFVTPTDSGSFTPRPLWFRPQFLTRSEMQGSHRFTAVIRHRARSPDEDGALASSLTLAVAHHLLLESAPSKRKLPSKPSVPASSPPSESPPIVQHTCNPAAVPAKPRIYAHPVIPRPVPVPDPDAELRAFIAARQSRPRELLYAADRRTMVGWGDKMASGKGEAIDRKSVV